MSLRLLSLALVGLLILAMTLTSAATMTPAFASSESENFRCSSEFSKDKKNSVSVSRFCSSSDELVEQDKDECKESGEGKCSSSQTGNGAFSNNPNRNDNGGGIIETFLD